MSVPYNGYVAAQDWIQDLRPYSMKSIIEEIKARGFERRRLGVVSYGNVVAGNNLTYTITWPFRQACRMRSSPMRAR
jgi:hypothetical protein